MAKAKTASTKKKVGALLARANAQKAASVERNKSRAEALLALIARRKQRMVEDFYDVGEALKELLDQQLFAALGFASFEAMLAANDVMGLTQAKRLIALVASVPRDHALALGQEKAYELVAYTAATPELDTPAELAKADARIGGKPLSKASVRELRAATQSVRAKQRAAKPKSKAEREAERAAREARAKVAALMKKAGVARPAIDVTKNAIVVRLTLAQATALR
jgi:hypothetical protein